MIKTLSYRCSRKGLHDITELVAREVFASDLREGLLTIFIRHTSASLVIQENADPAVLRDLEKWIDQVAPNSSSYEHWQEDPDDMPAHIKGAITASHLSIPIVEGRLTLGRWQGIFLWEHRQQPRTRELVLHVLS